MPFMSWSEKFITGLQEIDEQHKWLVDETNTLYEEVSRGDADREDIWGILECLADYALDHFSAEEALLLGHDYPEAYEHKAEHDAFSKEIASLFKRYQEGGDVTLDTLEFLKNWLKHHILVVDMAYVPHLQEKLS